MSVETIAVVLFGSAAAAFVCGLSGFAFGMVALSVWVWVLEPAMLAPLVIFGSLVAQLITIRTAWSGADLRLLAPILIGGVCGVPLGAAALTVIDPAQFRLAVGCVMVSYSTFMLLVRQPPRIARWGGRVADLVSGFVGGIMSGFAGLSAPAPTIWGVLRGWEKDRLRCTLQVFNLAMHSSTTTAYLLNGTITTAHAGIFAMMLPVLLVAALVGARLYRMLNDVTFRRIVLCLLFVGGLAMLGSVARG